MKRQTNAFIGEKRIVLKYVPGMISWKPSYQTVYRWAKEGIETENGNVKLEVEQTGLRGRMRTTVEAVQRFLDKTNYHNLPESGAIKRWRPEEFSNGGG